MIASNLLFFFFGIITVSTGHVLKNGKWCTEHKQPFPELIVQTKRGPPLFPLLQQGTNIFYKPQFMAPGTTINSPLPFVEAINQPQLPPLAFLMPEQSAKPLKVQVPDAPNLPSIGEIPEAPVLPPVSMPEPPTVIIPAAPENPIINQLALDQKPIEIPDAPILPPIGEIPEAPVLPPLAMLEPPIVIIPVAPKNPIITQPAPEHKPIEIPDAPVLPSLGEIPEAPVLPPVSMPEPPIVTIPAALENPIINQPALEQKPIEIPGAPILPSIGEIPEAPVLPPLTMPEPPIVIIPVAPKNPIITQLSPEHKPIEISDAPVLPPFGEIPEAPALPPLTMPEHPMVSFPIFHENPIFDEVQLAPEQNPAQISEVPILPPFGITPEIPEYKPIQIPTAPFLPPINVEDANSSQDNPECNEQPAPEKLLTEIPEAPVLPPLTISELPAMVIPINTEKKGIHSNPEFRPIIIPEASVLQPFIKPALSASQQPIHIPEAPFLPPLVFPELSMILTNDKIPTPPELPPVNIPLPVVSEIKPLPSIPEAPQLPSLTMMPERPSLIIEEPATTKLETAQSEKDSNPAKEIPPPPTIPAIEAIQIPIEGFEFEPTWKSIEIPTAPQLPSLSTPASPKLVVVAENNDEPCEEDGNQAQVLPNLYMPTVTSLSDSRFMQPMFWAQNIIIDRVLPNMIVSDKEYAKATNVRTKYPVITKPYFVELAQE